jgi:hypothetical protein
MRAVHIHARKIKGPKANRQTIAGVKAGGGVPVWIQESSSQAVCQKAATVKKTSEVKTPMHEACDTLGGAPWSFVSSTFLLLLKLFTIQDPFPRPHLAAWVIRIT